MAPRAQTKTMAATKTPGTPPQEPRRRPASSGNRAQTPRQPPTQEEMYDKAIEEAAAEEQAKLAAAEGVVELEPPQADEASDASAVEEEPVVAAAPIPTTTRVRTNLPMPRRQPAAAPIEETADGELSKAETLTLGAFAKMAIAADKPMSVLADELEAMILVYRKASS